MADRVIVLGQTAAVFIGIAMIVLSLAIDWLGIGVYPGIGSSQVFLGTAGFGVLLTGFALGVKGVRRWGKRFIFSKGGLLLCSVFAGLLIAEGGLHVLELITHPWTSVYERQLMSDPKLGVRVRPYRAGTDANGFRNDTVSDKVDVIAIGDSQTWGYNARRSEAWPQTLAKLSGHSVYNMALGGYGPVQYLVLTEEALKLSPKVIVIGLYFGNDLWDAYKLVYANEAYRQLRNNGATSGLLKDTVAARAKALEDEYARFLTSFQAPWSVWLARHSSIVRLLHQPGWWPGDGKIGKRYNVGKAWASAFPGHGAVYENGRVRTVFTTAYRLLAVDFDDPRISEGLRITKEMIRRIQARTDSTGVNLLVLSIPTKEMVYAKAVKTWRGHLDKTYSRLVQMERRATTEVLSMCKENGIRCLDALPILELAAQRGERIYSPNRDSHPNGRGYFLLASAVHEVLIRGGWLAD